MSTPTIEEFGRALFGDDWKVPTEALLRVDNRTLRRWMADPAAVPAGVTEELWQACIDRTQQLQAILGRRSAGGV